MTSGIRRRVWAGVGTVAVAAAVNVATGMFTERWTLAWGLCAVVVVVVGGVLQAWLTVGDGRAEQSPEPASQVAEDVTVGGSASQEMHGPGQQRITRSEVEGDLSQIQRSDRHDPRG
ncbi:hypothetical protein [Spirillospora albida]|uniref:hypothetical protein n=1 Tax=Spirillospora albida TaxID=58123 RepID=UPI0004C19183|nr:hypothetical protein [Spirillospora albida]